MHLCETCVSACACVHVRVRACVSVRVFACAWVCVCLRFLVNTDVFLQTQNILIEIN